MSDPFVAIESDQRPLDPMNHLQIGLLLGLDSVLREAGLILVCPRCAADGNPVLATDNSMTDETWKIDCHCRRRRSPKTSSMMVPSGWLLQLKDDLLAPLSLDVRCPRRQCLLKPLTIRESADGMKLSVECHCGNKYDFKKRKHTRPN